jgi:hypothetical protein
MINLFEVLTVDVLRLLEVGDLSDVEPVCLEIVFDHRRASLEHFLDQQVHAEVGIRRDHLEDLRAHDVDARQDEFDDVGFFLDPRDAVSLKKDVPEGIRCDVLTNGDGQPGLLLHRELGRNP